MQTAVDNAQAAFLYLCRSVGSPYATDLYEKGQAGNWLEVYNASMPVPSAYHDASAFAADLACYSYLRKYEGNEHQAILAEKALSTFRAVEQRNLQTNLKLRHASCNNDVEGLLYKVQRKIARLLGKFSYEEVLKHCEWGGGATSTIKLANASVDNKMLERSLSVSPRCLKYARAWLENDILWMSARLGQSVEGPVCPLASEFQINDYGVFDTVVKDAKSRRTIDKQPTLNLFFQKGIGKVFRNRLRRVGVILDDQSINQGYAAVAHLLQLSTLDLANASNTVVFEFVRLAFELSDPGWFDFLQNTRTTYVRLPDGTLHKLELFSSMGNGFTFELESLLFWAIASSVAEEQGLAESVVSVYGDDIIVSRPLAKRLITALTEFGFEVNDLKSFIDGQFFESCGGQYFAGVDVTPPYQKEVVDDIPSVIRASNRLLRWGVRLDGKGCIDETAHDAWSYYQVVHSVFLDQLNRKRFNQASRLMCGRRPKRVKAVQRLTQPYWVEGDGALIHPDSIIATDRDGIGHLYEWKDSPVKNAGDNYALLALSLRRSHWRVGDIHLDDIDTSFNGLVTIKGKVKKTIQKRRIYVDGSGTSPRWRSDSPATEDLPCLVS